MKKKLKRGRMRVEKIRKLIILTFKKIIYKY